jgi:DNA primase
MQPGRLIPENLVEEIKARNDIVSVVEQHVHLDKRSGQNYFGLCPFHSENTPSFSVSPTKQIYYCFGCNKGGDVIGFVKDIEKVGYLDALRLLADRAGIRLPEPEDDEYRRRSELNRALYAVTTEAARYFYLALQGPSGERSREYLKRRGILSSTARKFGLGYAPDEWEGLLRHLRAKGYDDELLGKSGLFTKRGSGGMTDLFRGRLMFPILDVMGRIVAFGGRVLDEGMPKYINSPETSIYTKGRQLFALNLAKASREKKLIVVEGYMDAISMHQAGVDNTVASLGTAMTDAQATTLRKFAEEIVIAYDSDAAGQNAAIRGLDILSAKGCRVSVLQVPEGKDPDEFIRKNGSEVFRALIDKALPLMDFRLLVAGRHATKDGTLDILAYQDEACRILSAEPNAIVRELYADKVAERCGISADSVMQEIERRRTGRKAEKTTAVDARPQARADAFAEDEGEGPETAGTGVQATKEEFLLACMVGTVPGLLAAMQDPPAPEDFTEGPMRLFALSAIDAVHAGRCGVSELLTLSEGRMLLGHPVTALVAKACMTLGDATDLENAVLTAQQYLLRARRTRLRARREEIAARIDREPPPPDLQDLKSELLNLTRRLSEMKNPK